MKSSTPNSRRSRERKLSLLRERAVRRAEGSLSEFIRQAWHVVEPGRTYIHNWHIDAIALHLEAVMRGEIARLVINIPFRCMKSLLVSVFFPAWVWTRAPRHRWLTVSHNQTLTIRDNDRMRLLIESTWYQERWGERVRLKAGQNQKTWFENTESGRRLGFGLTSGITGEGGDTIIIDDPHNTDSVESDLERETAIRKYDREVSTRLNDPDSGRVVLIMQRLHEEDLAGHVLAGGGWDHLMIPMEFDPERASPTSIGWTDPRNHPNELMWPSRFSRETVDRMKRTLGSYGTAGQLQQSPAPPGGGIFKRHWWQWYPETPREIADRCTEILQSWDMAFKDKKTSSYVVGQVWGRIGGQAYLLDQTRDKLSFTDTLDAVRRLSAKWPKGHRKIVEDKANGPAVIDALKSEIPGIVAQKKTASKESCYHVVSPFVEAGNVSLPTQASWTEEFLDELSSVPYARNDDQADACAQALEFLFRRKRPGVY